MCPDGDHSDRLVAPCKNLYRYLPKAVRTAPARSEDCIGLLTNGSSDVAVRQLASQLFAREDKWDAALGQPIGDLVVLSRICQADVDDRNAGI